MYIGLKYCSGLDSGEVWCLKLEDFFGAAGQDSQSPLVANGKVLLADRAAYNAGVSCDVLVLLRVLCCIFLRVGFALLLLKLT